MSRSAKTLYLECYSGISGDMTVAALLDLGADQSVLEQGLKSLPVDGFSIKISRVKKSALDVCDFCVELDDAHENHDHDMEYLHGGGEPHRDRKHHHEHRGLKEIRAIIEQADITPGAKEIAVRIFTILAEAEARVHGAELENVHFHEVGAVDSIVDIVAAVICLDNLEIENVIVPRLYEGRGFVRCQHGVIPVPVPAVLQIIQSYGIKLHVTETEGELVTPTGAAIVAAIRTKDQLPESFFIEKIGMGAGKRKYNRPGILRAWLIRD